VVAAQKQSMEELKIEALKHFGVFRGDAPHDFSPSDWYVTDSTSAIMPEKAIAYDEIATDYEEFVLRKRRASYHHHTSSGDNNDHNATSPTTGAQTNTTSSRRKRNADTPHAEGTEQQLITPPVRKRAYRKRGGK